MGIMKLKLQFQCLAKICKKKQKSNQAVRIVRVKFELCDVITEGVPVPSEHVGVPHVPKQDEGIVHNLKSKQKKNIFLEKLPLLISF